MTLDYFKKLPVEEQEKLLFEGGRVVYFTYVYSYIVMTCRKTSRYFFLKKGESPINYGFPYFVFSLIFGWWGIPWGPIRTIQSLCDAFRGIDAVDETLKLKPSDTEVPGPERPANPTAPKFCPNCGSKILSAGSNFCPECGYKLI